MNRIIVGFVMCFLILSTSFSFSANLPDINPHLLKDKWPARWITYPDGPFMDYGVFHFRRSFTLSEIPSTFVVHVTADNRYQLFVNGTRVCWGPARGDLLHWRFDTIDIAPYLGKGKNVIAAVVWNHGAVAAFWQISNQTGFLLQGDDENQHFINTGKEWLSYHNKAYSDYIAEGDELLHVSVVGPGEKLNSADYPWGWEQTEYDDHAWKKSIPIPFAHGLPREYKGDPFTEWFLVPRPIPFMEEIPEKFQRIPLQENARIPASFLTGNSPYTIPANTRATILFDQGYLTSAYLELTTSGGNGSSIRLTYAESLWKKNSREKGNRNIVEGKEMRGYSDMFLPDGRSGRLYRPLYWRTFRYLQMEVETGDEPLTLESFTNTFNGYPYEKRAAFKSSDPELEKIWDIGWRTLRLCTNETFFDCP